MAITAETAVRDIAVEFPTTIALFERLAIDYCCGGQHTLAEACAKRNLQIAPVLEELESQREQSTTLPENHWRKAPLKDFAEYIVQTHHAYTRDQLKLIDGLMTKVEQRHGADHLEVFQVGKAVAEISSELTHHFGCEETTLFPYIAGLGTKQRPELPAMANGSLEMPITRMMTDHDQAGNEFQALRKLTHNYTPPPSACPTWHALYRALEDLEFDLHQHVHLENNILFPRALEEARTEAHKNESNQGSPA
ncbi:MAG: iron-sulfur cluster repair di-iron protein [Acidobacteriaceae bacterium]